MPKLYVWKVGHFYRSKFLTGEAVGTTSILYYNKLNNYSLVTELLMSKLNHELGLKVGELKLEWRYHEYPRRLLRVIFHNHVSLHDSF